MYSSYRSSLKYCPFEYNTLFFPIQTFFAANRTNTNAQLSLALAWNRSDIAKNEIFTSSNKTNYQVRILSVVLQDKSAVKNCRFWLFFATCCRSGFMYKAFYASSINFSDIVLPPPPSIIVVIFWTLSKSTDFVVWRVQIKSQLWSWTLKILLSLQFYRLFSLLLILSWFFGV